MEFGKDQIIFVTCISSLVEVGNFNKFPLLQETSAWPCYVQLLHWTAPALARPIALSGFKRCAIFFCSLIGQKTQTGAIFSFSMYSLPLVQNWAQLTKCKIHGWINIGLIVYKIIQFAGQILIFNPDPRIWN